MLKNYLNNNKLTKEIVQYYPRIFTLPLFKDDDELTTFLTKHFESLNVEKRTWEPVYKSVRNWHLDDFFSDYRNIFYLAIVAIPRNTQYMLNKEEYLQYDHYPDIQGEIFTPAENQLVISRCDVYHRINHEAEFLYYETVRKLYRYRIITVDKLQELFKLRQSIILPAKKL
jgi:hypothetical protein